MNARRLAVRKCLAEYESLVANACARRNAIVNAGLLRTTRRKNLAPISFVELCFRNRITRDQAERIFAEDIANAYRLAYPNMAA